LIQSVSPNDCYGYDTIAVNDLLFHNSVHNSRSNIKYYMTISWISFDVKRFLPYITKSLTNSLPFEGRTGIMTVANYREYGGGIKTALCTMTVNMEGPRSGQAGF